MGKKPQEEQMTQMLLLEYDDPEFEKFADKVDSTVIETSHVIKLLSNKVENIPTLLQIALTMLVINAITGAASGLIVIMLRTA